MNQATLPGFDLHEGRRLRDAGHASLERHPWVTEARRVAAEIAHDKGSVTSDDVHKRLELPSGVHVNAWGSVFRRPYFEWDGSWTQSERPEAHARWIRRWRLTEWP